jgi:hypothetical protein
MKQVGLLVGWVAGVCVVVVRLVGWLGLVCGCSAWWVGWVLLGVVLLQVGGSCARVHFGGSSCVTVRCGHECMYV